MKMYLNSLLVIGILCVAGTASADIIVQADQLATGSWLKVVSAGSETAALTSLADVAVTDVDDNLWCLRRNGPAQTTGYDSFHSRGASDDSPEMTITTSGLIANAQYDVYVRYHIFLGAGGTAWMGNFGLTSGNMTTFNGLTVDHSVLAVGYRADMMVWESLLGTATSTAGGSLAVYFDDNGVNEGNVNGIRLVPPPPVTITESGDGTAVAEGGITDTFDVRLAFEPNQPITLSLYDDAATAQVTIDPCEILFTDTTWSTIRTVTVAAIDDSLPEADPHTTQIAMTAAGNDSRIAGVAIDPIDVSIAENDCGGWGYYAADINQDCVVNLADFARIASEWLSCSTPHVAGCTIPSP